MKIKSTKSAGGVVLGKDGRIVIVRNGRTSWSLPKGRIEPGETAINAARREIYEETGLLEMEYVRALGSYQRHPIGKNGEDDRSELKTITLSLFRTNESRLQPVDQQNPEARWVEKENVAGLLTHPRDKEFFLLISKNL